MRAHPRGSGALGCLGQTAARRSLSGSRILRASEVPGCKSVGITGGSVESVREKTDSRTAENIMTKKKKQPHVKALLRDEELGHGAKRNGVGPVLLQRRGSLAHQQARRHQVGGHFGQFELQILQNTVGDSVSG